MCEAKKTEALPGAMSRLWGYRFGSPTRLPGLSKYLSDVVDVYV